MRKKFFTVFIGFMFAILATSFLNTFAETSGVYTYTVSNGEVAITGCDRAVSGVVTIPDIINGYPVTSISGYAFNSCRNITSVIIPDTVKNIESGAFIYCYSLAKVSIGNGANFIHPNSFSGCSNLKSIDVKEYNEHYSTIDGNLYNKDKTTLIIYMPGKNDLNFDMPNSVLIVGEYAFAGNKKIKNVNIGKNVKELGERSFANCDNLVSIEIPESVITVCDDTFSSCDSLANLSLGNGVTTIGQSAFAYCGNLVSIKIPDSVTTLGRWAFSGCEQLADINIGDGVKKLDGTEVDGCPNLVRITIGSGVERIETRAFTDCGKLVNIQVDIENEHFSSFDGNLYNKDKTELLQYALGKTDSIFEIPEGVVKIGNCAFEGNSHLKNVNMPDSVTSIGSGAFEKCFNLTSVSFSENTTDIGISAFEGCSKLSNIAIPDSVVTIGQKAFEDTLYYNDSNNWENGVLYMDNHLIRAKKNLAGSYKVKPGTKTIAESAFSECSQLKSVEIPDGITRLEFNTFYSCLALEDVKLPDSLVYIGLQAFSTCESLEYIILPDSVEVLGDSVFMWCSSLKKIAIPPKVTKIGYQTFTDCDSLEYIVIPKSVTSIDLNAFSYCDGLSVVYYAGNNEEWEKIDIYKCSGNNALINAEIMYNSPNAPASASPEIIGASSSENALKFISEVEVVGEPEIETFGTAFIPLWLFETGSANTATVIYDNSIYNIRNKQTFGATLTSIPASCRDMVIVGKSFVKDSAGNYVWSAAKSATVKNTNLVEIE